MIKIASNIRYLRELKKRSQEQLADDLKITRARLGAYEEGRNEPPLEMLIRLSEHFHISLDALIKGDLRKTDPEAMIKIGKNRILFPVILDRDLNDQVEVITVKASAGYLNGYSDPEYFERLPFMKLPFAVTGKHRSFPIRGDSMPPLKTGDFVIGKYVESLSDVISGRTYVMVTRDDGLSYKRIYKKTNAGLLEFHSDNKAYDPYNVKASNILEAWEFVCCLKVSDKKEDEINLDSVVKMLRGLQVEVKSIRK